MAEVSSRTKDTVVHTVLRDMRPSLPVLYGKSGLAVLVGGFLSLFVCGQFGVSVSSSALQLHDHVGGLSCVIVCGVIFAVAPALILRLLCSPLQFKVITRQSFHVPVFWIVGIGGFLAYHGEQGRELMSFVIWSIAAVAMFEVISRVIDLVTARMGEQATWT